jgi:RND family efflux transporter MFP subunit
MRWDVGNVRKSSHWKIWSLGSILLVTLAFGGWRMFVRDLVPGTAEAQERGQTPPESGEGENGVSTATRVEVIHPLKGGLQRTTTQPGTVQSFESVQLYSAVSGYLQKQTVDIGDKVKRGQLLIKVDVPELEKQIQRNMAMIEQGRARVNQMQARVATAEAEKKAAQATVFQAEATAKSAAAALRFREQQLQRYKDLFALKSIDERLVDEKTEQRDAALEAERAAQAAILTAHAQVTATDAKIQQAHADVKEAEAQIHVAQAELEKAQVLVQYSTIVAPFDGVITQRSLFVGDFVRSAGNSGSRGPLLTVQRTDLFRVVVQIPDRDVPYCDPGDQALVEIDALPGKKFPAKVCRIADSEDPDTRLMRVEIDVPNAQGALRNGMYGRVTIILDKALDQLSIPSSCLAGRSQDGKASVYVVQDGKAHLLSIEVGPDNGLRVAVLRGLRRRDEVIQNPGSDITEGTPVVVANPQTEGIAQNNPGQ